MSTTGPPDGDPPLEVKVWGDFACFTRPEMKAERVSYPLMNPSAARGLLEAIFWKPEMRWRVREIAVLSEVRWFSIVRNEVNSKAAVSSARGWERSGGGYFAEDDRAQRHTLALRDVSYLIHADLSLSPRGAGEHPAKFRDQFRRRVERGQAFAPPNLGCREFVAAFAPPDGDEQPIDWTEDLGRMFFDVDYAADGSGRGTPRFFEARIERGVLRIPPELYQEVA